MSNALSRARKRLRGDPVSPSPNKGKRRRLGPQTTLPSAPDSSSSEDEDYDGIRSLFISNSPVKAPAGAKSFTLLFDDRSVKPDPSKATSSSKTLSVSRGLFGQKLSAPSTTAVEDPWDINPPNDKALLPKQSPIDSSEPREAISPAKNQPEIKKSTKRSLSFSEPEKQTLPIVAPALLPPSPPALDSSRQSAKKFNSIAKGKAKSTARKRAKTADNHNNSDSENDQDDSEESSKLTVKIINRTRMRLQHTRASSSNQEGDDLDDLDPILGYTRRVVPRGQVSPPMPPAQLEGKVEVDLPDKLRNVIALESAESKVRDSREERLVKGLVSGHRVGHYDPMKGGEIWDIGEDNLGLEDEQAGGKDTEGEDDWEGEPVPWEVGEL